MKLLFNPELRQSIKTNKLIINITNEEYDKIYSLIHNLKKRYKKEKEYIKKNKEKFDKIKSHNLLVKEIVREVIENFEILKKYKVCIFFTGSYARYTNKLNSDLDLHFSYKNKYRKILFKYEEMIYYILLSIFDLDRGKVHNMILSKINKKNVKKIKNKIDNNDLEILLSSDTKNIKYRVRGNIKSRVYLQYVNKKDMKTIYKYLKREILSFNSEWTHVFYIFTNQEEFNKYYNKLLKTENAKKSIKKLEQRKERISTQIDYINKEITKVNRQSMCDFKKIFQMEEFKLLYEYISYKRDMHLFNNKEWEYINLEDNMKYLKEDPVFKYIEKYLYNLFKYVESLEDKYSIHKECYIDNKYFKTLEKDLINTNKIIRGELWKD